jgi:hypoxanthine phosphoribosyltransferase
VREVFSAAEILQRVQELGRDISDSYSEADRLLVVVVLKGAFAFAADLVRHIDLPLEVDFVTVSSYGDGTVSSGDVRILQDPSASLEGRVVLLVEDIVDSGNTLKRLIPDFSARGAQRVDVCALLHKNVAVPGVRPRWVGFDAPDEFLVGYGLDHAGAFRHLSYIGRLEVEA